jgi:hypothetical protein
MATIDARLLDCQSTVEVEENFNRVLSISDSKKADKVAALAADATLPQTVTAFNGLLTKLKAAGLMKDNVS